MELGFPKPLLLDSNEICQSQMNSGVIRPNNRSNCHKKQVNK